METRPTFTISAFSQPFTLEVRIMTLLECFNDAFNRHDVDGMMAMMTRDCIFENTYPAPDGTRVQGQEAVRAFWAEFFEASPAARIDIEEIITAGDRSVQRWSYTWGSSKGDHVRGVDVFLIRDGKIAEKLSYVKG